MKIYKRSGRSTLLIGFFPSAPQQTGRRLKTTTALEGAFFFRVPVVSSNKKIVHYNQRVLSSIDIPVSLTSLYLCTTGLEHVISPETYKKTRSSCGGTGMKRWHCPNISGKRHRVPCSHPLLFCLPSDSV